MLFPIQFIPYVNYLRRRLFGNVPLATAAHRKETLCAAEIIEAKPAIFLPGQLDRITGADIGTSIELELSAATSQILRAAPTISLPPQRCNGSGRVNLSRAIQSLHCSSIILQGIAPAPRNTTLESGRARIISSREQIFWSLAY